MDKSLDFLTKTLVDKAIAVIDSNGIPSKRNGTRYEVLIGEKRYPYKLVVTETATIAGVNLTSDDFRSTDSNRKRFQEITGYQIIDKGSDEMEYERFKILLEYFVSHLEWVVNDDENFLGYPTYIKPLIDKNRFKKTGQGYAGDLIQEQIRNWDEYKNGKICINIQPNFGSYKSSKSYLNWLGTGLNIIVNWNGNQIDFLHQEEYLYWEENPSRVQFGKRISIKELGLFNSSDKITEALIEFYKTFNDAIIKYNNFEQLRNMRSKLKDKIDLLQYKKQVILQGPPGTGKTLEAKLIAMEMLGLDKVADLKNSHQFILVQFHPSYTYEDFVRGIVSKPNIDGDGIVYEAEDKTLGAFAKLALENHVTSLNKQITSSETDVFEAFIDSIKEEMVENEEHKVNITDAVYLFSADESRFKYKGDNWVAHSKGLNMKFSELLKIIDSGAKERQDLKKLVDLEELTRQHATYFIKVVEKYYAFKSVYKKIDEPRNNVEQKNYVLIIDEINRANLSSVLGELIYALEYRGEPVESMYSIDGDNKLILPPNLYIIGTMNTADRSVGHIDYAIRRRFAFVDVLPKDLSQELGVKFDVSLYNSVSQLFETNLSSEFDKNDVQLGHSYFIDKSEEGGSMDIRLKYEIAPILFEYVKDGILIGDDINQKIEDLSPSV